MLGIALYINWKYAVKNNFLAIANKEKEAVDAAISKRIMVAQTLYAAGALLCFVSSYLSIAVIIAIQINYAFGIVSGKKSRAANIF